jgi:hypothetical protein
MKLKYLNLLLSSFLLLSQNAQAMNDEDQNAFKESVRLDKTRVSKQAQEILKNGTAVKISGGGVIDISKVPLAGVIAESKGHLKLGVRSMLDPVITTSSNAALVVIAQRMLGIFEAGKLFTPAKVSDAERKDSLFRDRVRTLLREIKGNFWNAEEQCPRELHAEGVAASLLTLARLKDLETAWHPLKK